eukprot:TRINITY_DN100766_c0_g1_i1.p1 TRINITY_DN100766_c0_g1~~TRINITY_DN100766_c0_g1_i1.p1  ORF type:complete len:264 (+),score=35.48 TRINITY_DN100766_c0_g1_i1:46-837(+)
MILRESGCGASARRYAGSMLGCVRRRRVESLVVTLAAMAATLLCLGVFGKNSRDWQDGCFTASRVIVTRPTVQSNARASGACAGSTPDSAHSAAAAVILGAGTFLLVGCAARRHLVGRQMGSRYIAPGRAAVCMHATEEDGQDEEGGPSNKTVDTMRKFSNQYAKVSGTKYCSDPSVASVVIIGLAQHKEQLGAPLCPCRHYEDKEAEVKDGYWNCPCVPMRERYECHCMLFLKPDDPFAGDSAEISIEEVLKVKDGHAGLAT